MSVAAEMFNRRNWDPYRIPFGFALGLFLLSLFIHFSGLILASRGDLFPAFSKKESTQIPVELVFTPPAVDTLQQTAKEKPKDAQFQSSRNLNADQNTSPEKAASNVAQKRGEPVKSKPQASQRAKTQSEKIMSITQDELLAKGEIQKETLRGDRGSLDSAGFFEKLKKGNELKISALESDYGQYITRMKRKIAQQWNPQRTINAAMYNYNQIQVELAVVLNDQGEIVDLRIIGRSGFLDYDSETSRAVRDASPFPNPPKSLIQKEDRLIYMPWSFTVFMNQAGSFRVD